MLYTMQDDDELYGGARRKAPELSPAQVKAEKFKKQIREKDADFLDKYMQQGYEQALPGKHKEKREKIVKILEIVRQTIDKSLREKEDLGWITLMKSPRRWQGSK